MPSGVNVPLTFEIYKVDPKGDQLVRKETLTQDIIKVGKLSSSHLRIDDEDVSRMHAVIEVTSPTEINIIDLGSTKGTVVNGQKINKTRLQSGDRIALAGAPHPFSRQLRFHNVTDIRLIRAYTAAAPGLLFRLRLRSQYAALARRLNATRS